MSLVVERNYSFAFMGACCSKAQVTDIESVGYEPAHEHIPVEEIKHNSAVEWPDLLDLNSIPRGGASNAFKAAIAVVPVTKLTRKQCALPQKILALLSPVSLIDVKFKDIDTYQVCYNTVYILLFSSIFISRSYLITGCQLVAARGAGRTE